MRTTFHEDLEQLGNNLVILGNSANESVHKAVKALKEKDKDLAHELIADDLRINAMTIDIEKEAYRLISLQQPVTRDLRQIFTILLASSDIERLADHAVSIGRAIIRRDDSSDTLDDAEETISNMAQTVTQMLTDAIEAFIELDDKGAREIALRDEEVDALLKQIYTEIPRVMDTNNLNADVGIGYIGIANNLERIGDYVTNICERIVYLTTGDIIELN